MYHSKGKVVPVLNYAPCHENVSLAWLNYDKIKN